MSTLEIRNLQVSVNTDDGMVEILKGVDLTIKSGETHAIMGPNGSGKSTLAYSIAGHPKYTITGGSVTLDGADVLDMTVDERAKAGLFLAMQYPVEVPGVSVSNFLRTAATALRGEAPKLRTWVGEVKDATTDIEVVRKRAILSAQAAAANTYWQPLADAWALNEALLQAIIDSGLILDSYSAYFEFIRNVNLDYAATSKDTYCRIAFSNKGIVINYEADAK